MPITSSISGASCTVCGIEFELAGLDLGEVEHLVDEAEQVGAGADARGLSGSCAFSVPKRAALVTIISVSPMMALSGVRSSWLMLARNCDLCWLAICELAALVLDLVEQPHVLDRDHRLVGEGGDQLDLLVGEWPHRGSRQASSRRSAFLRAGAARRARCESRQSSGFAQGVFRIGQNVGNVNDFALQAPLARGCTPAQLR